MNPARRWESSFAAIAIASIYIQIEANLAISSHAELSKFIVIRNNIAKFTNPIITITAITDPQFSKLFID
jgi:hypothetical protein